jgi:hypothetical protein
MDTAAPVTQASLIWIFAVPAGVGHAEVDQTGDVTVAKGSSFFQTGHAG